MSLEKLPGFRLQRSGHLGTRFRALGVDDFRLAAGYVRDLPYGRNSDRSDWGLVLVENRGTCSTKHALLAALAREHGSPVELRLGIYLMDVRNTPGVGPTLARYGLDHIPEAHCYLAHRGGRVDLTTASARLTRHFLHEEKINPDGIGAYKIQLHKRFLEDWATEHGLDVDQAWLAREECIAALSSG